MGIDRVGITRGQQAWQHTRYQKERFSKTVRGVADLGIFFLRDEIDFSILVKKTISLDSSL